MFSHSWTSMVDWKKEIRALSWQQQQTPPPSPEPPDSLAAVQAAAILFLPCNRRLHASPSGKLRFLQSHVDWGKLSFCSTPTSFVRVACCCFVSSAPRNTSTRNQFCSFFFKPFRLMFEIKRTASAVHSFFSLPLFPFPIQQCFTLLPPCGLEDPFELLSLVWCNTFILKNVPMCAQTWLHDHTGTDANYYFTIIIINMMEYNNHGFFFFLIIYIFNSFSQIQVEREVYLIWQFPRLIPPFSESDQLTTGCSTLRGCSSFNILYFCVILFPCI